jgi:restriction system protein
MDMSLWLVRAGSSGEYENKFLQEGRIYLTWSELSADLSKLPDKKALTTLMNNTYPNSKPARIRNWVGQGWPFVKVMAVGDWVIMPSKKKSAIHIGEIKGDYVYAPEYGSPYYHYRDVEWFAADVPRSNFDQDLLYTFGAFLTICRIKRNDAENRIKGMAKSGWKASPAVAKKLAPQDDIEEEAIVDLEQVARDQIANAIIRKYKGHGLARLVNAILEAQGYTTYMSPEGPDKGVDILAAPGSLGFGSPRICVQVKSSDVPLDRPTLDQLIGAMQNFHAEQGLLVSWGGFKSSVDKEVPSQFFRVRLWDANAIINEFLLHYDAIDEDIRAEIPLKRFWALTVTEDD